MNHAQEIESLSQGKHKDFIRETELRLRSSKHMLFWTALITHLVISLVAQTVKRLPSMRDTRVWSLGWEDPLEEEMATHSSTLAWKFPWMEERGRLQSMRSQRVGNDWLTSLHFTSLHLNHPSPLQAQTKQNQVIQEDVSPFWSMQPALVALSFTQSAQELLQCTWIFTGVYLWMFSNLLTCFHIHVPCYMCLVSSTTFRMLIVKELLIVKEFFTKTLLSAIIQVVSAAV